MKKKLNKEEKKEKIKKILKIVGCSIGLVICGGAFIGLLFVGVRGCSSTPRSNNANITIETKKDLPQNANNDININGVDYKSYVLGGYNAFGNVPTIITSNTNNEYQIKTIINDVQRAYFGVLSTTLSGVRINAFNFYNIDRYGDSVDEINIRYQLSDTNINETFYNIKAGDFIYFNSEDLERYNTNNNVNWLFDNNILRPYEDIDIRFNNLINPFGPVGNNYDYIYKNDISGNKLLFKGLFKDLTGQLYKSINIWFLDANNMSYGTSTEYKDYTGDGVYYLALYYVKLDGTEIYVNGQDFATATSGAHVGTPIIVLSNHWISSMFQSIHILTIEDDSNYLTPQYDRLVALTSLNNNVNGTSYYTSGGDTGGNPFTLIGSAFSSLIPILSVSIIPGLTIGTLLLVPLVAMIVLFIVFLFKR